jgi:hypothetical protein
MLRYIKKERGLILNTELFRLLLKEEYDRLRARKPYAIEDPLIFDAQKFIKEHRELGYSDFDDFVRSAIRDLVRSAATSSKTIPPPR